MGRFVHISGAVPSPIFSGSQHHDQQHADRGNIDSYRRMLVFNDVSGALESAVGRIEKTIPQSQADYPYTCFELGLGSINNCLSRLLFLGWA